jgi:hypothetical protein
MRIQTEERDTEGFARRGHEVSRLMAFVDAAFAFSLTLLVVSFDEIPKDVPELIGAIKGIPAFLASFALMARVWWVHSRYCWRFGLEDRVVVLLSLVLVAVVLVFVYPLRIVFNTAFAFITAGFLPWTFNVASIQDLTVMFIVYGLAWVCISSVLWALYLHAWRKRDALMLDHNERIQVRLEVFGYAYMAVIGALSIAIALTLPASAGGWVLGLPGWCYFLMFLLAPMLLMLERRWRATAASSAPD